MQFVIGFMSTFSHADMDHLGLMGFSLGGTSVTSVASRDIRVKAVISLDGWHEKDILKWRPFTDYKQIRAPFISLVNKNKTSDNPNRIVYDSLGHKDAYCVRFNKFGHLFFGSSWILLTDHNAAESHRRFTRKMFLGAVHSGRIKTTMNERNNLWAVLLLALTLASCSEGPASDRKASNPNDPENSADSGRKLLVDYKSDRYNISIGDNYKHSDKIIDWRWAALDDPDDKIDSTGQDAFLYLEEPLIQYNNGEWLPSLHIETDKNIITTFACSILFELTDTTEREIRSFLKLLGKDIKQLQSEDVRSLLAKNGVYEKTTRNFVETFILVKAGEYENDRFEYRVNPKEENGR